mgnify:FL=1
MELPEIREQIDKLDDQITELFLRRMELCKNAAEIKADRGLPVLNREREREILRRVRGHSGDMEQYTHRLFTTLFELSRAYQESLCSASSKLRGIVEGSAEHAAAVFPQTGLIACQGVEGAYSQMAADRLFPRGDIVYFKSFEGVFGAVENGLCQFGVLPIENSSYGSVRAVYDLIRRRNVYIVRSARLCIRHRLLVKPGTGLEDVTEIYSHEQALGQCGSFLKTLGDKVKLLPCDNTATAARYVARRADSGAAAISSAECAGLYGLVPLDVEIQDSDNNYTRFVCISKRPQIYPGANRISLILALEHRPGSLYEVLAKLAALQINLIKLESCPIVGHDFEFMFFFELEASVFDPNVISMLESLERDCRSFIYLGNYSEV